MIRIHQRHRQTDGGRTENLHSITALCRASRGKNVDWI